MYVAVRQPDSHGDDGVVQEHRGDMAQQRREAGWTDLFPLRDGMRSEFRVTAQITTLKNA